MRSISVAPVRPEDVDGGRAVTVGKYSLRDGIRAERNSRVRKHISFCFEGTTEVVLRYKGRNQVQSQTNRTLRKILCGFWAVSELRKKGRGGFLRQKLPYRR